MQNEIFKIDLYTVGCMLTNALNLLTFEQVDAVFEQLFVIEWLRSYDDLQREFLQLCNEEFTQEEVEKVTRFLEKS